MKKPKKPNEAALVAAVDDQQVVGEPVQLDRAEPAPDPVIPQALRLHTVMQARGWKFVAGKWYEPCPYAHDHGADGTTTCSNAQNGCDGTDLRLVREDTG